LELQSSSIDKSFSSGKSGWQRDLKGGHAKERAKAEAKDLKLDTHNTRERERERMALAVRAVKLTEI
jgi:hypothetical protein